MDKKTVIEYISVFLVTTGAIVGFVFLFQNYHSSNTKAQENSLTLILKLHGEWYPQSTVKATVTLYNPQGKAKEFNDIVFAYQNDKTFFRTIMLDPDLNYNTLYAIYIKPTNYFGKLFCSTTVNGKECIAPQFILKKDINTIDLSGQTFYGGDIKPANGKVDAYDISKIMANLGTSTDLSTDINNDGITNTMDYILALYSLSKNYADDAMTLVSVPLTPTAALTATPTATLAPTTAPTATPTATLAPTSAPTPTVAATPTPTGAATPTPAVAAGVCHLIPGSMAKQFCGIQEVDMDASAAYSACEGGGTGMCAGSSKAKCTCPAGKTCSCQLLDKAAQTVNCTNGGKVEIVECN